MFRLPGKPGFTGPARLSSRTTGAWSPGDGSLQPRIVTWGCTFCSAVRSPALPCGTHGAEASPEAPGSPEAQHAGRWPGPPELRWLVAPARPVPETQKRPRSSHEHPVAPPGRPRVPPPAGLLAPWLSGKVCQRDWKDMKLGEDKHGRSLRK